MSKRFTPAEDAFIHAYHAVANVGPNDLGRTRDAINRRVKILKSTGAWDALGRMKQAERDYYIALGYAEIDADIASIVRTP